MFDPAVVTLTEAFLDDPLMSWVLPDAATRPTLLARWWQWMFDHQPAHAHVLATDDSVSAALWYAPDLIDDGAQRDFPQLLIDLLGEPLAYEKLRGLSVIPASHPRDQRHWYLAAVGTRPEFQGQRRALEVIEPILRRADAEGLGTYLESSNERNVAFYERLGFVVTGRIQIPDGPFLTPMWRVATKE